MDNFDTDWPVSDLRQTVGGPPMNQVAYIPPGNESRETYRQSTFKRFPASSQVNISSFKCSGFFYTGYKDRVQCFSCGQRVEGWTAGDAPGDSCWHKANCKFSLGLETRNIPIGSRFLVQSSSPVYNVSSSDESWEENFVVDSESRRTDVFPTRNSVPDENISEHNPPNIPTPTSNEIIDAEMEGDELVDFARNMGFNDSVIRQAVKNIYELHRRMFSTRLEIVEEILRLTESSMDDEIESVEDDSGIIPNKEIPLMCRICSEKQVSVVFHPCSHFISCDLCASKRERCPMCSEVVSSRGSRRY